MTTIDDAMEELDKLSTKDKILQLLRSLVHNDKYCNYNESFWMRASNQGVEYGIVIFFKRGGIDATLASDTLEGLLKQLENYLGII